jgi:hypothetical protein
MVTVPALPLAMIEPKAKSLCLERVMPVGSTLMVMVKAWLALDQVQPVFARGQIGRFAHQDPHHLGLLGVQGDLLGGEPDHVLDGDLARHPLQGRFPAAAVVVHLHARQGDPVASPAGAGIGEIHLGRALAVIEHHATAWEAP